MIHPKILVLSVSAGTGHTRAAEALRSHAAADQFGTRPIHLDVLQFVTPLLRFVYTDAYNFHGAPCSRLCGVICIGRPILPRRDGLLHKLRRWAERINSRSLLKEIGTATPDLIICTHFLPAELLSQLLAAGSVSCPVWVQVTDFDLHRMWVHDHMAGYFAPNEEVAFRHARTRHRCRRGSLSPEFRSCRRSRSIRPRRLRARTRHCAGRARRCCCWAAAPASAA